MVVEKKPFYTFVKTVFDYAAALVLLVLLSPVFLVLVIMIRRDSPGPAIFTQERLGKNGKIFKIYDEKHIDIPIASERMMADILEIHYGIKL